MFINKGMRGKSLDYVGGSEDLFAQAIPYLLARRPLGYLLFIMELAGLDRLFFLERIIA